MFSDWFTSCWWRDRRPHTRLPPWTFIPMLRSSYSLNFINLFCWLKIQTLTCFFCFLSCVLFIHYALYLSRNCSPQDSVIPCKCEHTHIDICLCVCVCVYIKFCKCVTAASTCCLPSSAWRRLRPLLSPVRSTNWSNFWDGNAVLGAQWLKAGPLEPPLLQLLRGQRANEEEHWPG